MDGVHYSTPAAAVDRAASVEEVATQPRAKRRRARDIDKGDEKEKGLGGFGLETLKVGARGFCRFGTPFSPIYQLVRAGMMWDLARDRRLWGQSPLGPGSMPTADEIKAIEDIRLVLCGHVRG